MVQIQRSFERNEKHAHSGDPNVHFRPSKCDVHHLSSAC